MDTWVLWLIAAVVLAVAEVVNLSFFMFPFAIGAAGAALVSLAGAGTPIRSPQRSSCSMAAARNVSPAASSTPCPSC